MPGQHVDRKLGGLRGSQRGQVGACRPAQADSALLTASLGIGREGPWWRARATGLTPHRLPRPTHRGVQRLPQHRARRVLQLSEEGLVGGAQGGVERDVRAQRVAAAACGACACVCVCLRLGARVCAGSGCGLVRGNAKRAAQHNMRHAAAKHGHNSWPLTTHAPTSSPPPTARRGLVRGNVKCAAQHKREARGRRVQQRPQRLARLRVGPTL